MDFLSKMCYFAPQTKVLNNEYKVNQLILNNQEMDEKNTKVRPTIIALNVGETAEFPLFRLKSVRVQTSEISTIYKRKYRTHTDKVKDTISVERLD